MKYALEWIERCEDAGVTINDLARRFGLSISCARCYICAQKIGDARWHLGVVNNSQEVVHTACFDAEAQRQERILEIRIKTALTPMPLLDCLTFEPISGPFTYVRGESSEFHAKVHAGDSVQAGESGEHHQRHVSGQKPPTTIPRDGTVPLRSVRHDGEGQ